MGKRALKVRVNYYYIHLRVAVSVCGYGCVLFLLLLLWMAAISVPIFEIFEYFVFQLVAGYDADMN